MPATKLRAVLGNTRRGQSDDAIYVLDPELEVRDGTLDKGKDKDIDVKLKDPSGTCQAAIENKSVVYSKKKVTWKIKNNCKSDRTVKVVFSYPEGSPLEPCTLEATVEKGKKGQIQCRIREDANFSGYRYDLVVTAATVGRVD